MYIMFGPVTIPGTVPKVRMVKILIILIQFKNILGEMIAFLQNQGPEVLAPIAATLSPQNGILYEKL